jgi:hypothetical protein
VNTGLGQKMPFMDGHYLKQLCFSYHRPGLQININPRNRILHRFLFITDGLRTWKLSPPACPAKGLLLKPDADTAIGASRAGRSHLKDLNFQHLTPNAQRRIKYSADLCIG